MHVAPNGALLALLLVAVSGCSTSLHYGSSGAERLALGAAQGRMAAVDLADGRANRGALVHNQDLEEDLADLRDAVHDHYKHAGLTPGHHARLNVHLSPDCAIYIV